MSALSVTPTTAVAGATAAGEARDHSRHLLGNALRAVRVVAGAAFEVVILGRVDEQRAGVRLARPGTAPHEGER
ncbi:hypothetical protein [Streptomyces sp. B6B3]|uniref:hypothetical protein n=1 Tax=Streptomyces sp. B6B3 TaxID=3153570 RepID=UPI00325D2799